MCVVCFKWVMIFVGIKSMYVVIFIWEMRLIVMDVVCDIKWEFEEVLN